MRWFQQLHQICARKNPLATWKSEIENINKLSDVNVYFCVLEGCFVWRKCCYICGVHCWSVFFSPPHSSWVNQVQHDLNILLERYKHPGRLTWNLRIDHWKRKLIFQIIIFRFYVNLPGCNQLTKYDMTICCFLRDSEQEIQGSWMDRRKWKKMVNLPYLYLWMNAAVGVHMCHIRQVA